MAEPSPTSSPHPKSDAKNRDRDSKVHRSRTAPPVLASEALREDIAPLRPWNRAIRVWDGVFAVFVCLIGVLVHTEVLRNSRGGPWAFYGLGGALILLSVLPLLYTARGAGSLLLGMVTVALGLGGFGPLDSLVAPGHSPLAAGAKTMAATALPAALLFRARYRAYAGARVALLVALVATLPAVILAGMAMASGPLLASVAAALTLVAILTSLLGFMGEGTTAASTAWAIFVVVMFGSELMARSLWMRTGWEAYQLDLRAGAMMMVACALTSKGLFQLLARAFAEDARRVDVLRKRQPSLRQLEGEE
ncbi:MAG: hypothetical protein CSA75_02530 [Sorangium cellulosum]|nr:MAG: hypothetical protein CSA75_02530 [Sorangium cellulosum]